jgi:hypothetical protein
MKINLRRSSDFLVSFAALKRFAVHMVEATGFVPRIRMPQRRWAMVLTTNGHRRFAFSLFSGIRAKPDE